MKKKVLSVVLALTMIAACAAGCGSSSSSSSSASKSSSSAASSSSTASTAKKGSTMTKSELVDKTADYSKIKIGSFSTDNKDDGGWTEAQYKGITDAMKACGMDVDTQLVFMEFIPEEAAETTNAVEALVKEGCNVIMGASTGYAPILSDLATQYPDVLFTQAGAPADNLVCYQIRDYQSMYLLGYMCGLMSDSDQLGFSAGMSEASVRRAINAFALGAKYAKSSAKVKVVWANSWYDPTAEAECANSLISSGIKYIGVDASSPAIPQACEKAGAYCTGYHKDVTSYAPGAVLCSFVWNWAPIMESIFTTYAKNGLKPFSDYYFWGSDMDCSQISAFNDTLVPADVQQKVKDLKTKVDSGEIQVYGGELKDNEGKVLVPAGSTMSDDDIITQEFLVDNVDGTWK